MVTRETSIADGLAQIGLPTGPDVIARLARFAGLLEDRAIPEGFLGPNERERIVARHVLESCALARLLPAGSMIDVGSGAGLPGIPLACLRDERTVLLDSNERRGRYLRDVVAELAIDSEVVVARAEESARTDMRDGFATAVCRALAAPAVVLELCLPFVAVGGTLAWLITPGSRDDERSTASAGGRARGVHTSAQPGPGEIGRLGGVAAELGGGDPQLVPLEVPGADARRWAMIVNKVHATPDRFPRRTGVPARRPLG
jgi:16S rRNA (guanine527-N7)-methyltransferase